MLCPEGPRSHLAHAGRGRDFAAAHSIDIEVLAVYEKADAVAGELRIVVNGKIELYVVDVIQFDAQGQVAAIRSYKGRAD